MKFEKFIGIDVSKKTFDVAISFDSVELKHSRYVNDVAGVKFFLKELSQHRVVIKKCLVCMEHTGIYTHLLLKDLHAKGANIWLEQAMNIKRSLGVQRGKNDKVDSMRIAQYAQRFQDKVTLWQPARKEIVRLKNLISLRERLVRVKKSLATPLGELIEANSDAKNYIAKLTRPVIEKMSSQIIKVEHQIDQLIKDDKHLSRLEEIITSVDGVGRVTAWQVIATTNEFKDFKGSRQFACYSGVVPFDHSSGTSIYSKPRVSHLANKRMKELLHLSALSATIMKGELNDYYKRKVAEGKNKMLVLNNIRNKLIQRIFSCVKENRKYEKIYTSTLA